MLFALSQLFWVQTTLTLYRVDSTQILHCSQSAVVQSQLHYPVLQNVSMPVCLSGEVTICICWQGAVRLAKEHSRAESILQRIAIFASFVAHAFMCSI